jgi:hypothetical protein
MTQLENIEAIEKRLWAGADNLRANSKIIGFLAIFDCARKNAT